MCVPTSLTVFIRLNAAAFIKFFVIRARHFFEGGVYLKSNLFLANNSMLTDHFNFKKQKHVLVLVYKKSFFVLFSISQFAC